jgi:hypothetical protein
MAIAVKGLADSATRTFPLDVLRDQIDRAVTTALQAGADRRQAADILDSAADALRLRDACLRPVL